MKFDQTFIAIRERGIFEIFDLTLKVIRDHLTALIVLGTIGVLPWMILDIWLLQWVLGESTRASYAFYAWLMALLVTSQAQVATSFVTRYLGDAMFEGRPEIGKTIRAVFKTSFFFVWAHGGLRLLVPSLILAILMAPLSTELNTAIGMVFLPLCVGTLLLVRALRPFCSEMLCLNARRSRAGIQTRR